MSPTITDRSERAAATPDLSAHTDAPAINAADDLASLKVVGVRHVGRWVSSAVVAVLLAQLLHAAATNKALEWKVFAKYVFDSTILNAVLMTLELTFLAAVFGFVGGVVLAAMRLSRSPLLRGVSWAYVWLFRSVPLIVQVLLWGNLAILYRHLSLGVPFGPGVAHLTTRHLLTPFIAAVVGLSICEAAYAAEVVRGGIISVDQGQTEAANALGIPRFRQFRRIIFPQAMRTILPSAANQLIGLVKSTSIVYVLAIGELFYQVTVIYGRTTRVIPLLTVATFWYVVMTTVLSIVQYYIERYFSRGALRTMPPTPIQRLRSSVRSRLPQKAVAA
jgi:polar amino acid transport system permease protein